MAQVVMARRRGGWGQAFLWGTVGAGIIVVLDAAVIALYVLLAPKTLDLGPNVLISLALLFAVGVLVGHATGRVGVATVAGLIAGIVSTLVEFVLLLVLVVVGLASQPPRHQGTGSGEGGLGLIGIFFLGIFLLVLLIAALLVFRLLVGAGLGALGALLGRALGPRSEPGPAYVAGPGPWPPGGVVPGLWPGYPFAYPYPPPSGASLPGAASPWTPSAPAQQPAALPSRPSLRARAVAWWTERWAVRVGVITALALAGADMILIFLTPRIILLGLGIAPRYAVPGVVVLIALVSTALLLAVGLSAGYAAPTHGAGLEAGLLAGVLAAGLAGPLDVVFALVLLLVALVVPPSQVVLDAFGWSNGFEISLTLFFFLLGPVLLLFMGRALIGLVAGTLGGLAGALVTRRRDGGSPADPDDGALNGAPPDGGGGPVQPADAPTSPAGSTFPPASAISLRA